MKKCLLKEVMYFVKENPGYKCLVNSNEYEIIISDVFKNNACKPKPKHANIHLPDYKNSVKKSQISQVSNNSHGNKDNNEKFQINKQHELHLIKYKSRRFNHYFNYCSQCFRKAYETLDEVKASDAKKLLQLHNNCRKILSNKCVCIARKRGNFYQTCNGKPTCNKLIINRNFEKDLLLTSFF